MRQYRNAVADLIGSFRTPGQTNNERGLHAEYFKSRQFRASDRVIDRRDREVKFDFGESSPDPEKLNPQLFSIRWKGSVFAPETGEYEFIVRSEHGTQLWINDPARPLIDAGDQVERRNRVPRDDLPAWAAASIRLKLEFVEDHRAGGRLEEGEGQASVGKGVDRASVEAAAAGRGGHPRAQPLAQRGPRDVRASTTPFPADDRSVGYERGSSVSKDWDQAATDAAFEVAGYVHRPPQGTGRRLAAIRPTTRSGSANSVSGSPNGRSAGRSPTSRSSSTWIAGSPRPAISSWPYKRAVLLVLKSPLFLYRYLERRLPGRLRGGVATFVRALGFDS